MLLLLLLAVFAAIFEVDLVKDEPHEPWPLGLVPYNIPVNVFKQREITVLHEAMEAIQRSTCVKFIPRRDADKIFMYFQKPRPVGNAPRIGYTGSTQPIFITMEGSGGVSLNNETILGNLIHELLHTLGLSDENNRQDRDDFVKIMWHDILPEEFNNFYIDYAAITYNMPYDYQSIMHENPYFGNKSDSPSLKPKHESTRVGIEIGQRKGMACSDILKINFLYNCTNHLRTEQKSKYLLKGSCPPVVTSSSAQISDENEDYMVYAEDRGIYKMSLFNYTDTELVVDTKTENITMDADCKQGRIFWFDQKVKQICWVNLNDYTVVKSSFDAQEFPGGVGGIVFNSRINHLYLTNPAQKRISYMRIGKLSISKISGQIKTEGAPQGIAIDPNVGLLFWCECNTSATKQCRIMRADVRQHPIVNELKIIISEHTIMLPYETKSLHVFDGKLYMTFLTYIISYNYDGQDSQVFLNIVDSFPIYISSSTDWLYWTGYGSYPYSYLRIFKANKTQNDTVAWIKEEQIKNETTAQDPKLYSGMNVCRRTCFQRNGYMLFAEDKGIYKMSLTNQTSRELVVNTETEDMSIDVDCKNQIIFWYDQSAKSIYMADLVEHKIVKASDPIPEITSEKVGGIAFNSKNNHVYLTNPDGRNIFYMKVEDNFTVKGSIATKGIPRGIAFDDNAKLIFWYECDSFNCRIIRANITVEDPKPNNVIIILKEHLKLIFNDLSLMHVSEGKFYGIAGGTQLFSCDYNGENVQKFASIFWSVSHIGSSGKWIYLIGTERPKVEELYSYIKIFRAKKTQNLRYTASWIKEELIKTEVKHPKHYSGMHVCPCSDGSN